MSFLKWYHWSGTDGTPLDKTPLKPLLEYPRHPESPIQWFSRAKQTVPQKERVWLRDHMRNELTMHNWLRQTQYNTNTNTEKWINTPYKSWHCTSLAYDLINLCCCALISEYKFKFKYEDKTTTTKPSQKDMVKVHGVDPYFTAFVENNGNLSIFFVGWIHFSAGGGILSYAWKTSCSRIH